MLLARVGLQGTAIEFIQSSSARSRFLRKVFAIPPKESCWLMAGCWDILFLAGLHDCWQNIVQLSRS